MFLLSSRWSRGTVKKKGFELATTLVTTSDFQNCFPGALRAPEEPPGRGKTFRLRSFDPALVLKTESLHF